MHNARMIYGYAHVSTDAQDLTSQLAQLKAAGCEEVFREPTTLKPLSSVSKPGYHAPFSFSQTSSESMP
jgi:hypothetical protein